MKKIITGFTIGFVGYFLITVVLEIVGVNTWVVKIFVFIVIGLLSLFLDKFYFEPRRRKDKV